ncbi:hypothetical protein P7C71_g2677, partial [Lecanoromycetidae sp. Uapishka_2]
MSKLPSIANLMSPPEAKPLESFSITPSKSPSTSRPCDYTPKQKLAPMAVSPTPDSKMRVLPSPPVSPWMNKRHKQEGDGYTGKAVIGGRSAVVKDPVLYPESGSFESVNEEPLFSSEPLVPEKEEMITKHMAMHMQQFDQKINRPTREEYRLALSCVAKIGTLYNRSPGAYMKRQREETEEMYWKAKRICARPGHKAAPVAIAPAPKQTKRAINRAVPTKAPAPRVKRTPKPSPMAKLMGYPDKGRSATPDRLPGTKREDVDYNALPDYAPPTSTLPKGNPKVLKADWASSNVLNLSNDPDLHMLHEAEVNLAGTLRLTCATYLCSKRRIFDARLTALKIGKEFRKTDAQQACKIDVNKASKLWTAYDKVGWFDKNYFQQFL